MIEGSTCSALGKGLGHTGKILCAIPLEHRVDPTERQQEGDLLKCFQELCPPSCVLSSSPGAQSYKDTDDTAELLPSREDLAWSVAAWIRKCVLDSME